MMKHKNQIAKFAEKHKLSVTFVGKLLGLPESTIRGWSKAGKHAELIRRALRDLERDVKSGKIEQLKDHLPRKAAPIKSELERARKEKGKTIREVAEAVGCSYQNVSLHEKKGLRDPVIGRKFADALGVTLKRVMEPEGD